MGRGPGRPVAGDTGRSAASACARSRSRRRTARTRPPSARSSRGASGDAASPGAAGQAGERALRAVADEGYPYARLSLSRFEVDTAGAPPGAAGGVALSYAGTRGPRVVISRLRVDGLKVTRPDVATRALGRLTGRPWDRAAALAARERLAQLGLFRNASFEGLEGEADWSRACLVYRVEEPRYNRFEAVAGFQGDAGTAGLARLELGNLLGTGRSAALRWESRGRGRSDFEARYAEPLLLGAPLRLEGVMQQQIQDSLYARTRWGGTRALHARCAGAARGGLGAGARGAGARRTGTRGDPEHALRARAQHARRAAWRRVAARARGSRPRSPSSERSCARRGRGARGPRRPSCGASGIVRWGARRG